MYGSLIFHDHFVFEQQMKVAKCPTDELSLTNCAVVNEQDFDVSRTRSVCFLVPVGFLKILHKTSIILIL